MLSSSADRPSPRAAGLDVRPFRALTYRKSDPAALARVSSPAYDLVTPAGRDRLAAADTHNIVRLILPRVDREDGAGAEAHAVGAEARLAAETLRTWVREGVLGRDAQPALWLYEMDPGRGTSPTAGWLAAVGLPEPGSAAVLPHEDTYPPAVEDRRALLAATAADLEPIVLAHDPVPGPAAVAEQVRRAQPTFELADGDLVRHRLWRVADPTVVDAVATGLQGAGSVIADGHHRFAAANAHHRSAPGKPGADAVLALLTPMGAGGLRVQPIHRVLPDLDLETALGAAGRGFRVDPWPTGGEDPESVAAAVLRWLEDPAATGFLVGDGRRLATVREPTAEVLATVPAEAPAAWRRLDVVLAHHGLIEHLWRRGDDPASVEVVHDARGALAEARDRSGVALFLRAPSPGDVAAVARAGARMPRKSTLFVPKPRTGLVLRPHAG